MNKRLWEVDALRGVAILMMVIYHLLFDLSAFGGLDINVYSGFWRVFARITATLFIFLVGVSLTISLSKAQLAAGSGKRLFAKYLKRGLWIFGWGLAVTLVTWLLFPEGVVIFGILHFIGLSVILAYPFLKLRVWNLALGLAALAVGLYLQNVTVGFPWLLWLGLQPAHFYTFDYFPVLPWFGVTLLGLFAGNSLYADSTRRFPLPNLAGLPPVSFLSSLGRHSLTIYLLHQPILLALLSLLGIIKLV